MSAPASPFSEPRWVLAAELAYRASKVEGPNRFWSLPPRHQAPYLAEADQLVEALRTAGCLA